MRPVVCSVSRIGSTVVAEEARSVTSSHSASQDLGSIGVWNSGKVTRSVSVPAMNMARLLKGFQPMVGSPAPSARPAGETCSAKRGGWPLASGGSTGPPPPPPPPPPTVLSVMVPSMDWASGAKGITCTV